MNKTWQLHDAKNKFSKMVNCAITQGAQIVTRRGKKVVVIMSFEEYDHLQRQNGSLAQFLLASPLSGLKLNIVRNKSKLRTKKDSLLRPVRVKMRPITTPAIAPRYPFGERGGFGIALKSSAPASLALIRDNGTGANLFPFLYSGRRITMLTEQPVKKSGATVMASLFSSALYFRAGQISIVICHFLSTASHHFRLSTRKRVFPNRRWSPA